MAARGEGIIQAGEREVPVFFNNWALARAEAAVEKSIIGLAEGFSQGTTGISDVAQLLRAGMEAHRRLSHSGSRPVSLKEAYEVMDEAGFAEVATVVMEAVAAVLGYSPNGAEPDEDEEEDPNG